MQDKFVFKAIFEEIFFQKLAPAHIEQGGVREAERMFRRKLLVKQVCRLALLLFLCCSIATYTPRYNGVYMGVESASQRAVADMQKETLPLVLTILPNISVADEDTMLGEMGFTVYDWAVSSIMRKRMSNIISLALEELRRYNGGGVVLDAKFLSYHIKSGNYSVTDIVNEVMVTHGLVSQAHEYISLIADIHTANSSVITAASRQQARYLCSPFYYSGALDEPNSYSMVQMKKRSEQIHRSIAVWLKYMKWRHVMIVRLGRPYYSDFDPQTASWIFESEYDMDVLVYNCGYTGVSRLHMRGCLDRIRSSGYKIILPVGRESLISLLLLEAQKAGMLSREYVWLLTSYASIFQLESFGKVPLDPSNLADANIIVLNHLRGDITHSNYEDLIGKLNSWLETQRFSVGLPEYSLKNGMLQMELDNEEDLFVENIPYRYSNSDPLDSIGVYSCIYKIAHHLYCGKDISQKLLPLITVKREDFCRNIEIFDSAAMSSNFMPMYTHKLKPKYKAGGGHAADGGSAAASSVVDTRLDKDTRPATGNTASGSPNSMAGVHSGLGFVYLSIVTRDGNVYSAVQGRCCSTEVPQIASDLRKIADFKQYNPAASAAVIYTISGIGLSLQLATFLLLVFRAFTEAKKIKFLKYIVIVLGLIMESAVSIGYIAPKSSSMCTMRIFLVPLAVFFLFIFFIDRGSPSSGSPSSGAPRLKFLPSRVARNALRPLSLAATAFAVLTGLKYEFFDVLSLQDGARCCGYCTTYGPRNRNVHTLAINLTEGAYTIILIVLAISISHGCNIIYGNPMEKLKLLIFMYEHLIFYASYFIILFSGYACEELSVAIYATMFYTAVSGTAILFLWPYVLKPLLSSVCIIQPSKSSARNNNAVVFGPPAGYDDYLVNLGMINLQELCTHYENMKVFAAKVRYRGYNSNRLSPKGSTQICVLVYRSDINICLLREVCEFSIADGYCNFLEKLEAVTAVASAVFLDVLTISTSASKNDTKYAVEFYNTDPPSLCFVLEFFCAEHYNMFMNELEHLEYHINPN